MNTISRRECLARAKRWSTEVPKARTQPDKRRAARKVCDALLMFLTGRAPSEIER